MADNISSATFVGDRNQGFQLGNNAGQVQVNYHIAAPAPPLPPSYQLGLNLENAPQIDEQLFIGREDELAHLHECLSPSSQRQNVVAISGLGGIGKTQLGLHFARQHHQRYSAVIWLNASSEVTLKVVYISLAQRIRRHNRQREAEQSELTEQLKEEQAVQLVRQWLSQAENKTWLLIFDNYDDPRLPGIRSTTGYDIRPFFPYSTQGSILITTRSSRITFAKSVRLNKLDDLNQSLAVLTRRSGRQTQEGECIRSLGINTDLVSNDLCCLTQMSMRRNWLNGSTDFH